MKEKVAPMNIIDVLTAPWAIQPSKLLELQGIYAMHARGDKIDIAAIEARMGRPLANEQRSYEIQDGVAVLPIEGVIAKKMNLFSQISGGASSQMTKQALADAVNDPAVHSIILAIDSPGGTVDGTQALADAVRATRDKKPIVTLGSGTIASAAYWIGASAQAVYLADSTTVAGSIGIVTSHTDISGAEAARGIKTTEITAGKYKRVSSQYGPLSDAGRQSIQEQLDYLYSLFVGSVADSLGVSVDTVLADMAEGRVFTGQQAVDAGLASGGIITLDNLVAKLNRDRAGEPSSLPARTGTAPARPPIPTTKPKGSTMTTKEQIQAEHPALADAFRAEGASAERARIQAVEAQAIPGHEDLIAAMKFDGKSSAGDAALAVLAAEKTSRAAHATAAQNEAPAPLPLVPAASVQKPDDKSADTSRAGIDAKAREYMAAHPGTPYVAAYKAVGGK